MFRLMQKVRDSWEHVGNHKKQRCLTFDDMGKVSHGHVGALNGILINPH